MDKLKFKNKVSWQHFDPSGNLVNSGCGYNQAQTELLTAVRSMLYDDGNANSQIFGMGIGTGAAPNQAATALTSLVSAETCGTGQMTETDADTLTCEVTFTATASWTIAEAGLFGEDATCDDHMLFCYGDAHSGEDLSESLATDDTLTITWTIDFADDGS